MGGIGGDSIKGRGGLQSDINVLHYGGTDDDLICIRVLDPVYSNRYNGGRDTQPVSEKITGKRAWRMADKTRSTP